MQLEAWKREQELLSLGRPSAPEPDSMFKLSTASQRSASIVTSDDKVKGTVFCTVVEKYF